MRAMLFRRAILFATGLGPVRRALADSKPGRALAARFVAGDGLLDGLRVAGELHREGMLAILDRLGEHVTTAAEASLATRGYLDAVAALRKQSQLDAAIAVKPSSLGLDLGIEVCGENLTAICEAAEGEVLVMLDMESHETTGATIELFRDLHTRFPRLGVCLQADLHRTADDIFALPPSAIVRLVKGAYLEPHELAFAGGTEVQRAWSLLFATLCARGHPVHAATHDPVLVAGARELMRRRNIPNEQGSSRCSTVSAGICSDGS